MDESLVFSKRGDFWKYNRSSSTENKQLIEWLENVHALPKINCKCTLTPSGMNAIFSVFQTCLIKAKREDKKMYLIYSDELYTDTPALIENLEELGLLRSKKFDLTNELSMDEAFNDIKKEDFVLVFAESCSNPNGKLFPYWKISDYRKKHDFILCIDNTWLTHVIQNPFELDADLVVYSLTKYYSAGTVICGCILRTEGTLMEIQDYVRISGAHVSPHTSQKIFENCQNMDKHIKLSSKKTIKVIEDLMKNLDLANFEISHPIFCTDNIEKYGLFKSFQQKPLDFKTFSPSDIEISYPIHYSDGRIECSLSVKKIYPSVFTIKTSAPKDKVLKILQMLPHIEYKTSFGGSKSRSDPYPKFSDTYTIFRISIGYDQLEDEVIEDLKLCYKMLKE